MQNGTLSPVSLQGKAGYRTSNYGLFSISSSVSSSLMRSYSLTQAALEKWRLWLKSVFLGISMRVEGCREQSINWRGQLPMHGGRATLGCQDRTRCGAVCWLGNQVTGDRFQCTCSSS